MDMRHGLLRTSCSRNPENTSNPLIFLRKMATFRCFALHKVINFHASMKFMTFCRLSHFIRHRRKIQQGTAVLSTTAPCIIFTTADDLQLLSRLNNYVYSFLRTCGKMPHPDHSSVEVSSSRFGIVRRILFRLLLQFQSLLCLRLLLRHGLLFLRNLFFQQKFFRLRSRFLNSLLIGQFL